MSGNNPDKRIEQRAKFVDAFNDTMVRIWKEKIVSLGVISTGNLYRSVAGLYARKNQEVTEFTLQQQFLTYGLWQNYGTGRETPRGNPGDIGRAKVRKPRRWFDKKYYSSVMNMRDFFCDSLALQGLDMISNALSDSSIRKSVSL